MKYGYTEIEVRHVFDRLRAEVAVVSGDDQILTTPLQFADQGFNSNASTLANAPRTVTVNTKMLPFMYEDEIRSMLLHEMAHVVATPLDEDWMSVQTAGHGPKWEDMAYYLGADARPWMVIRDYSKVPGYPIDEVIHKDDVPSLDHPANPYPRKPLERQTFFSDWLDELLGEFDFYDDEGSF